MYLIQAVHTGFINELDNRENIMKRWIVLLISVVMVASFAAFSVEQFPQLTIVLVIGFTAIATMSYIFYHNPKSQKTTSRILK